MRQVGVAVLAASNWDISGTCASRCPQLDCGGLLREFRAPLPRRVANRPVALVGRFPAERGACGVLEFRNRSRIGATGLEARSQRGWRRSVAHADFGPPMSVSG